MTPEDLLEYLPPAAQFQLFSLIFCSYHINCTSKDYAAECRSPAFGVATYTSCEDPAHGVAQYNECEDFSVVAAYNTCLIRKTMPEVEAYIESTRENIQLLGRQLAKAESDYLLISKQAKLASCLIDRYQSAILYEEVVQDLKNNYAAMFGEDYSQGQFDCSSSTERVTYTLNGSPCESFSEDEILRKMNGESLSANEQIFYRSCQAETSARQLRNWFSFHEYETLQLLRDPVASHNEEIRKDLSNLKGDLSTSSQLGSDCPECSLKVIDIKTESSSSGRR